MRAPQQGRSTDELVAAMLALIDPPADEREEVRAQVVKDIAKLQRLAQAERRRPKPPPGKFKAQLSDYLKTLQAAKRKFVRWPTWQDDVRQEREQFLTMLAAEIKRVEQEIAQTEVSRTGGKQKDRVALLAIQCATLLLPRARRTKSETGPWHRLSKLFYEAGTGNANHDLMHYLRRTHNPAAGMPRYRAFASWDI